MKTTTIIHLCTNKNRAFFAVLRRETWTGYEVYSHYTEIPVSQAEKLRDILKKHNPDVECDSYFVRYMGRA